jgi:hypothetical protein
LLRGLLLLRLLAAGDEGWKPLDVRLVALLEVLRARLVLRVVLVVLVVLVMLVLLRLHLRVLLLLARIEGLRLRRKRLAADGRLLVVAVVVTVVGNVAARRTRLLLVKGLALAELLLCGSNQTKVMLGVLIVIFRRDRVAGTLRIAGQL